ATPKDRRKKDASGGASSSRMGEQEGARGARWSHGGWRPGASRRRRPGRACHPEPGTAKKALAAPEPARPPEGGRQPPDERPPPPHTPPPPPLRARPARSPQTPAAQTQHGPAQAPQPAGTEAATSRQRRAPSVPPPAGDQARTAVTTGQGTPDRARRQRRNRQ